MLLHSFTFAAQKSTTDVPMCSHWEATQGLSMDYTVTISLLIAKHAVFKLRVHMGSW